MLGHAGTELHALLFKMIQRADENYGRTLHGQEIKPFALGPLTGKLVLNEGRHVAKEGNNYGFSLATLNTQMTLLLPRVKEQLEEADFAIGGARFVLKEARLLYKSPLPYFKLITSIKEHDHLTVIFRSPTCFRHDGRLNLFPLPSLFLTGLSKRWNHFSDTPLPLYNPDSMQVNRYGLKTQMVKFGSYNLVGFTGFCKYAFLPETSEIDRWTLSNLFNYANLAGVGYKTAMGMGQVKVV
jgi:CRISPR-associated endoribonuclease Cas6